MGASFFRGKPLPHHSNELHKRISNLPFGDGQRSRAFGGLCASPSHLRVFHLAGSLRWITIPRWSS